MTVCVYPTVLNKPCGRTAGGRIRWQEQHRHGQEIHDWPLCPFHHDVQLAKLLLSCGVHSLVLLTPDGELILPNHSPEPTTVWPAPVPSVAELLQLVDASPGHEQTRTA